MRTGSIILLVLAAHGILLAIFVASYPGRCRRANQALALLILVFSLTIAVPKLVSEFCGTLPHLVLVSFPLGFAFGPLLYLYTTSLISKTSSWRDTIGHFAPLLLTLVYLLPFYFQSGSGKIEFIQRTASSGFPKDLLAIWVMKNIHVLAYVLGVYHVLANRSDKIKNRSSDFESKNLAWLKQLVMGFLVVNSINLGFFIIAVLGLLQISYRSVEFAVGSATSLLVYSVGFKGLRQPQILQQGSARRSKSSKYQRSGLSRDRATDYVSRLSQLMELSKPYKKPDLTLADLAGQLHLPVNHLSQILNETVQQNFFDFVNDYRVAEVKQMISDPQFQHLTVLAIAYEAGFNSKSAFYRAFKKSTGITPSKYVQTRTS